MTEWFTSDTHFGHNNMLKYGRGKLFQTTDEMDSAIIGNWNSIVDEKDVVYCLGDFAWVRKQQQVEELVSRLKGNIVLVRGNHDHSRTRKAHGFFDVCDIKEIMIEGVPTVMCHYPMVYWNRSSYGSWHLHGHTHGDMLEAADKYRIDVGQDNWDYFPVSTEQIVNHMHNKHTAMAACHHGGN